MSEANIESPVLATTKSARTTVDGGLTITIEILPGDVFRAFQAFGLQGSAMAVVPVHKDLIVKETRKAAALSSEGPIKRSEQVDIEEVIENEVIKEQKHKERHAFLDLRRTAQAGIRCQEMGFQEFMRAKGFSNCITKDDAALAVRAICGVTSRRELDEHPTTAGAAWDHLEAEYYAWQHGSH